MMDMEHTNLYTAIAHGMKEIWPETEKKIKAAIKTVSAEVPKSATTENILTTREDFK